MGACCSKKVPDFITLELNGYQRTDGLGQRKLSVITMGPGVIERSQNQSIDSEEITVTPEEKFFSMAGNSVGGAHINKCNQDVFLLSFATKGVKVAAVFDGHGINGQGCAKLARDFFKENLQEEALCQNATQHLLNTFRDCNISFHDSELDLRCSGTTAIVCAVFEEEIVFAHLGDCAALIGYTDTKGKMRQKEITRPHTAQDSAERARMAKSPAVFAPVMVDGASVGPERVWVKGMEYPGLVATRCLGNFTAQYAGCTSVPEIIVHARAETGRFVILATDGVSNVLESRELVSMVAAQPTAREGASFVCQEAQKRWALEGTGSDDVTAVVMLLQKPKFEA